MAHGGKADDQLGNGLAGNQMFRGDENRQMRRRAEKLRKKGDFGQLGNLSPETREAIKKADKG